MPVSGKLQLKGGMHCCSLDISNKLQCLAQLTCFSSPSGGNPWEVTKKKAKKKKKVVPEGEEAEVLAGGDIRTKGKAGAGWKAC